MKEKYKCSNCKWVGDKEELDTDGFNCPECGGKVNVGYQLPKPLVEHAGNLKYASAETIEHIEAIMESPTVADWTKQMIKEGLQKDCLDAPRYVQVALESLQMVREDIMNKEGG